MIAKDLKKRREAAFDELQKLVRDNKDFPINYNHYYTDNLQKRRQDRLKALMQKWLPCRPDGDAPDRCSRGDHYWKPVTVDAVIDAMHLKTTQDMERFSCEEALDCLLSIYKVRIKYRVARLV